MVNSILLRVVEKWMMEGIQSRPADLHLPRSVGLETVGRWEEVQKCLEQVAELMEHQREAIHCNEAARLVGHTLTFLWKKEERERELKGTPPQRHGPAR